MPMKRLKNLSQVNSLLPHRLIVAVTTAVVVTLTAPPAAELAAALLIAPQGVADATTTKTTIN
jgi:hypothetical protein